MLIGNMLRKLGSLLLFILYLGYIFYKAPVFKEFRVINLIEYILVLLAGGYFNFLLLRKEENGFGVTA